MDTKVGIYLEKVLGMIDKLQKYWVRAMDNNEANVILFPLFWDWIIAMSSPRVAT
jgi:hypothetical protein